ncbi:ubiquitin thioesterase trabid isoform X2 [Ischnura elegans]|uniref:ubiquitin thioesterase trabid isoform X2 n=1 Tax=Ischnura elegans TaxID=197161 RepID=UPI001ED8857F|nr:ubiquitin thioesterase trabid isoform X2 [Ischnura elegans]XP_046383385.1 ubiquitin thioesterase trabid isoform X2 [Ischnura elegans]
MSGSSRKWACEYCTFENWPSSLKCTMCRASKPPTLIAEAICHQDIYQLQGGSAPPLLDSPSPNDNPTSSEERSNGKWSCSTCTYLNWPSAVNCSECLVPRRKNTSSSNILPKSSNTSLSEATPLSLHEHLNSLYENIESRPSERSSPQASSPTPPPPPPPTPSAGSPKEENYSRFASDRDSQKISDHDEPLAVKESRTERPRRPPIAAGSCQASASGSSTSIEAAAPSSCHKWPCRDCTYENWPKATRCVMCGSPRPSLKAIQDMSSVLDATPSDSGINSTGGGGSRSGRSVSGCLMNNNNNNYARSRVDPSLDAAPLIIAPDQQSGTIGGVGWSGGGGSVQSPNNCEYERRLRQLRQRKREADWLWLNACLGVVEGDPHPVEAYISSGGNPARQLTSNEVTLLNRPSAFDAGHTLVHLAIRFHREDLLATLLSQIEGGGPGVKRVPSYVAPDLAADIHRHVSSIIRQRKGSSFPCHYLTEIATFALPAEVEDLPPAVQEQLLEELLDRDAQAQLEEGDPPALNWSLEVTVRLGSRLHALWNRSAGDCLLDSAMQATWGVFDRDNALRRALSESLHQGGHLFYPRWKEYESVQARLLEFSLEECQWEEDWAGLLSLAAQPGSSLEQLHVFALAHVLRRPIIVYGVKYVRSFRGEALGYARFEGVYLPLLWDPGFCWKSPVALGYTRGHFSALVATEPYSAAQLGMGLGLGVGAVGAEEEDLQMAFLPLMTQDHSLLPVHFLTQAEMGREESILRQWLDVCVTEGGTLVAQQRLHKQPLLVAQMVEEWLNHYRRLAIVDCTQLKRRLMNLGLDC